MEDRLKRQLHLSRSFQKDGRVREARGWAGKDRQLVRLLLPWWTNCYRRRPSSLRRMWRTASFVEAEDYSNVQILAFFAAAVHPLGWRIDSATGLEASAELLPARGRELGSPCSTERGPARHRSDLDFCPGPVPGRAGDGPTTGAGPAGRHFRLELNQRIAYRRSARHRSDLDFCPGPVPDSPGDCAGFRLRVELGRPNGHGARRDTGRPPSPPPPSSSVTGRIADGGIDHARCRPLNVVQRPAPGLFLSAQWPDDGGERGCTGCGARGAAGGRGPESRSC
jgi:hypothetical protein